MRNYVLVEELEDNEMQTESGIIISRDDDKRQFHGIFVKVLAVGPNAENVKVGTTVIVNRYDLLPFRHNTETLQLVKDELVFAVEEE